LKALIRTGVQEELRVTHQTWHLYKSAIHGIVWKVNCNWILIRIKSYWSNVTVIKSSYEKNKSMQVLRGKSKSFKHIPISYKYVNQFVTDLWASSIISQTKL
jgi:hypothetical protein